VEPVLSELVPCDLEDGFAPCFGRLSGDRLAHGVGS
jgi:hypothetical protein